MRISLSVAMGFMGMLSSLRGAKGGIKEVRERGSRVGADEQKAHAILARVGPHAALVLVACDDPQTRQAAVARAADQATESWDFSRTEFLANLDPGPKLVPAECPKRRPARPNTDQVHRGLGVRLAARPAAWLAQSLLRPVAIGSRVRRRA